MNVTIVKVFNEIDEAGELNLEIPFTVTWSAPVGLKTLKKINGFQKNRKMKKKKKKN